MGRNLYPCQQWFLWSSFSLGFLIRIVLQKGLPSIPVRILKMAQLLAASALFTEHLGQFNKFSLGLNANKTLNDALFVSSGIHLEQFRNSSSAVYSMQSNSRILWHKGPTQSSMFLTVGGRDRINYSLQHLYRIDSFLSLIAGWEGSRAQLFYGLHFEVEGMLCTFIQHERTSELKLALQHKNFWLQVTFKTGMLHSPTQFLCRL